MASDSDEDNLLDFWDGQSRSTPSTISGPRTPSPISTNTAFLPGHITEEAESDLEEGRTKVNDETKTLPQPGIPPADPKTQPYSRSRPRQPLANGHIPTARTIPNRFAPQARRQSTSSDQQLERAGSKRFARRQPVNIGRPPRPVFNESIVPGAPSHVEKRPDENQSHSRMPQPSSSPMPLPLKKDVTPAMLEAAKLTADSQQPNMNGKQLVNVIDERAPSPDLFFGAPPNSHGPQPVVRMNRAAELRQHNVERSPDRKPIDAPEHDEIRIDPSQAEAAPERHEDPPQEPDPETSSLHSEPLVHLNRAAKLRLQQHAAASDSSPNLQKRSNSIGSIHSTSHEIGDRRDGILRQRSEPDTDGGPWPLNAKRQVAKASSEGSLNSHHVKFDEPAQAKGGTRNYAHAHLTRKSVSEFTRRRLPQPPSVPPPKPRTAAPVKFVPKNPNPAPALVVTRPRLEVNNVERNRRISPSRAAPVRSTFVRVKAGAKKPIGPTTPGSKTATLSVPKSEKEKEVKEKEKSTEPESDSKPEPKSEKAKEEDTKAETASIISRPRAFISSLLHRKRDTASPSPSSVRHEVLVKHESHESKDSGVATTDESHSQSSSNASSPPSGLAHKGDGKHSGPTAHESLKTVPEESEGDNVSQTGVRKASIAGSVDSGSKADDDMVSYANREDVSAKLLAASQKGQWGIVDTLLQTADKRHLNLSMIDEVGFQVSLPERSSDKKDHFFSMA